MRGKDDKIAGNVGGEQAAKSEKADGVYASSNNAEYGREQSRAERALDRRRRNPGRPEFSYLRHAPDLNLQLRRGALAQTNVWRAVRSWRLFPDILIKQK